MDKQQLIEYLNAVCDAESAVQACEDAIALFEGQKRRVPVPTEPYAPMHEAAVKREVKANDAWGLVKWVIWFPLWVAYCYIFEALGWSMDVGGSTPHALACAIVTAVVISRVLQKRMNERKSEEVFAQERQKVAQRNQQADQQYRERMVAYQEAKRCYDAAIGTLDDHIQQQQTMRMQMQNLLDQLYSRGIIYPACRNLVAVYQIREYLKMGICDELEGSNGAYSEYQNDLRTARITDSIHELKESLTSAIRILQGTLMQELRTVNGNLTELGNSMSRSMEGISQQMQQMQQLQQAGTAQMSAHLAEANRHLASMRDNTAIMAHNQYVEQRIRNVDAYLLRWPAA